MSPVINLKDVGLRAGVSASTVSRVLRDKGNVNEKTKEKVLDAIKTLKYSPNVLAQGLKLGKTNTIALLVPSIHNEIFPVIARGVENVARKKGFTTILCNTDDDIAIEKEYVAKLKTRYIDGFIVASMLPESDYIRALHEEGFPVVLISRYYEEKIDAVIIDNYQAAYDGVSYLIRTGHRKIAIACGPRELSIYKHRYQGYVDALKAAEIPFDPALVLMETAGNNSFYYLMQNLLKKGLRPDAVFCTSDPKAIIIMRAIRDMRLDIPADISVLGFDNIEMSAFVDPPLSTISQPLYEMGSLGAHKLIDLIGGDGDRREPSVDVLATDLIIRKSTK
ncbi:MAG: HTH-type transcriptional repressor CytR [Spirochaetes bacterium ADurb.Bin110]|nr:MAG: HTH-type transcriptional repressor CytR [Spirochaetes bacterium ADurb.Bin110]HQH88228.1 LacI family DNA-binding transcriptional regulator [Rectinema sp.]